MQEGDYQIISDNGASILPMERLHSHPLTFSAQHHIAQWESVWFDLGKAP